MAKRHHNPSQDFDGSSSDQSPALNQLPLPRRVLIAGHHNAASQLAHQLYRHFPGAYTVVGMVTDDSSRDWFNKPSLVVDSGREDMHSLLDNTFDNSLDCLLNTGVMPLSDLPVVGSLSDVPQLIRLHQIDEVLIADYFTPEFKTWEPHFDSWAAPTSGTRQAHQQTHQKSAYQAAKRLLDIVFSLPGLLLMAPLLLVLGLLHKAMAPGPILFKQERVGQNGRRFQIYKLRTMRLDAEKESGPVLAQHRDPRCTPLGAFLRATKIDELPQLYNVLRGDMSLIGPRPERPCFVEMFERHIPRYSERHQVKPGLTGLAQVHGDQLTHVNIKLHHDLDYVDNCNLALDLWLLLRTPLVISCALLVKAHESQRRPLLVQELKQAPLSA